VDSFNEVRLEPLTDADQRCLDFRLTVDPPAKLHAYRDSEGTVHHFNHRAPHTSLAISADSLVETHLASPFAPLQLVEDDRAYYRQEWVKQFFIDYLLPTHRVPLHEETVRIAAVAEKHAGPATAAQLVELTRLLRRVIRYAPGATHVDTSILEVLENRAGVCQDFTHLMLAICRRQGIPARYVSGYLYTGQSGERIEEAGNPERPDWSAAGAAEGSPGEGPMEGLLAGDAMHAWVECLLPDGWWHGFDPTNKLLADDTYVKVRHGRDYGDVAPVRGIYRGPAGCDLTVSVDVSAEERPA
jgi:transglutaminase-like putative cysteine protease